MAIKLRLHAWRERYRRHRIRDREATRAARERVREARRDVTVAALERPHW